VLGNPALVSCFILEFAGATILRLENQVSHTAVNRVHLN
jgi:hypothetical protein